MKIDATNDVTAAMRAINATPIGEAGQFHAIAFFRDTKQQVTVIRGDEALTLRKGAAAAELVWMNLNAQKQGRCP